MNQTFQDADQFLNHCDLNLYAWQRALIAEALNLQPQLDNEPKP